MEVGRKYKCLRGVSMGKKSISKRKKIEEQKPSMKERLTEMLELPKEIVLNVPKFTMVGKSDLIIENYKGVIEIENSRIRINTGVGVVRIMGSRLLLKEITSEDVLISGNINSLEILG
jgi:sporulation protein YqfC